MLQKFAPFTQILRSFSSTKAQVFPQRLKGKVAVVTASTEGIGFAIAQRLGREGAAVVVSSRKEKNVNQAIDQLKAENIQVHGTVCHVASAKDRARLFDEARAKYGGVDILVSNAAVTPEIGPVLNTSEQAWDKIFDVNVKSSYLLAKEVLPHLRERGGGNIVFVSSIVAYQPMALLGAYSVSKTALLGLTKAASIDLAPENIRVNCLAPGIIETKFSAIFYESESAKEAALSQIPIQRLGQPDEMAGVVAFLVSDDGSYITGETITAAGGMASRL